MIRIAPALLSAVCSVPMLVAQEPKPGFEVASVRKNVTRTPGGSRLELSPRRFSARGIPLRWIIAVAYIETERELPLIERVIGGPAWMDTDAFDIEAVAGAETSRAMMRLMLQTLLEERFSLKGHIEKEDGPAYAVLLSRADGRPGPQLREPTTGCDIASPGLESRERRCGSGAYVDADTQSVVVYGADADVDGILEQIAQPTIIELDRPLINRTGLKGRFSFELRFSREATASAAAPGISLFTALQQQLGFRVERVTTPIEVLAIDSVEQPTEN